MLKFVKLCFVIWDCNLKFLNDILYIILFEQCDKLNSFAIGLWIVKCHIFTLQFCYGFSDIISVDTFLFARSYFCFNMTVLLWLLIFNKSQATDKVIFLYMVMFFLKNLKFWGSCKTWGKWGSCKLKEIYVVLILNYIL